MDRDAPGLAVAGGEQQRFVAEHEDGGGTEKIRPDHRRARRNPARAIGNGWSIG